MSKLKLSEQFRLNFEQLKSTCNNNPQTLVTFFAEKPEFEQLARSLKQVADQIDRVSTYRKLHPQVSPDFIRDWKEYLYKWKCQVEFVDLWHLLSINLFDEPDFRPLTYDEYKKNTGNISGVEPPDPYNDDSFDPRNHDGGSAISQMIDLVGDQGQSRRDNAMDEADDFISNTYLIGVEAIEYLENVIGIDIARVFERWNKLPTVFVPQHVSNKHGLSEKGSLFALFEEAVRAYIVGSPGAAIAMCRSLLEMVLREHYLVNETSERDSLHDVINLAVARYDHLNAKKLHSLRMDANTVLHQFALTGKLRDDDEIAILQFFKDLKFYIERAPSR